MSKTISDRIAVRDTSEADYISVLRALGYEVRPNKRMFRRLSMRKSGSDQPFAGVPDMSCAKDAALYLTPRRTGGRFIEIIQSSADPYGYWHARFLSYSGDSDRYGSASSNSLGAAMWAAYAASEGL